jgi:hypothetical protein
MKVVVLGEYSRSSHLVYIYIYIHIVNADVGVGGRSAGMSRAFIAGKDGCQRPVAINVT